MVKSVVREYKWSPAVVGDLFLDNDELDGLEYWYNDTKEIEANIKKRQKKK
jgi:hypothetical protein